jgi:prepilin-type N-terminal cleavage/methylation domain-containing protein
MMRRTVNGPSRNLRSAGFTLIEILIVIAILGLAVGSMFSVYLNMQKTTTAQDTVIDLQQNLRIAVESLGRDIRMAGFLIPDSSAPIGAGSNATTLILNMASPLYATARIEVDYEVPISTASETRIFKVAQAEMCDRFKADDKVRVIRAMDGSQPMDLDLTVDTKNRAATPPTITLKGFVNPLDTISYIAGDMIVRVGAADPDPPTVTWALVGSDLQRNADAVDISSVTFSYLLENGTETVPPAAPAATDLANIVAVRVVLAAVDTTPPPGETAKQRVLNTLIRVRNR